MIRRILVFLICIVLSACSVTEQNKEVEYLYASRDVELFSLLNEQDKEKLFHANSDREMTNTMLKMISKELPSLRLKDINGNEVDFDDYRDSQVFLEVAAVWCDHCKESTRDHLARIIEAHPEITFIQYFGEGCVQEIFDFYREISTLIPQNLIVIPYEQSLQDILLNQYHLEFYPSLICFDEGKVTFDTSGDLTYESFERFYDTAFLDPVRQLNDEEGRNVFSHLRDTEDCLKQLSEENYGKLISLDQDGISAKLTFEILGKKIDFDDCLASASPYYMHDLENYSVFKNKDLVLFYLYFNDDEEDRRMVETVNSFIKDNDIPVIAILVENYNNSSRIYEENHYQINAPVISILSKIPKDFYDFTIETYPTALFVEKGVYVGAYSSVKDDEMLKKALSYFIGEKAIVRKDNN